MNILEILDEFGFERIDKKPETILANLLKNALAKRFGKATIQSILEDLSEYLKKPEDEILSNYELFFKELQRIFGSPAVKVILKTLKEDFDKQGISLS